MALPSRILAAVDFSEPARVALKFAARLARHCEAELHVMHAEHPLLAAAAKERGLDLAHDTFAALDRFIEESAPAGRCQAKTHVIIGSAGTAIADATERERADLIVVGARGMSGAEHALLGSTTERVLRRARTSVAVVPECWAPALPLVDDLQGTGPVIAAVDFRIPSIEAAGDASLLAAALGTWLVTVNVVPPLSVLERWQAHADAALHCQQLTARRDLDRLVQRLKPQAGATVVVKTGNVAERVASAAHEHQHALLVVGRSVHAHRHGAPGTNAYRLLTLARVPVLMHVAR